MTEPPLHRPAEARYERHLAPALGQVALTCAAVLRQLPVENQAWHAKYANNEIYTLTPPFAETTADGMGLRLPGPGDLLYIPIPAGAFLPPGSPPMDAARGLVDYGYFYERGNTLVAGPAGPVPGTIFATARSIEEVEAFAESCVDMWFPGAYGERMYLNWPTMTATMIVDCHVNIWNDEHSSHVILRRWPGFARTIPAKADVDTLIDALMPVDRAIVFALGYGESLGIQGDNRVTTAAVNVIPKSSLASHTSILDTPTVSGGSATMSVPRPQGGEVRADLQWGRPG